MNDEAMNDEPMNDEQGDFTHAGAEGGGPSRRGSAAPGARGSFRGGQRGRDRPQGSLALRVDELISGPVPGGDAGVQRVVALVGTSLCSGRRFHVTYDEAEAPVHDMTPLCRRLGVDLTAGTDYSGVPEEMRPVVRCDRVSVLGPLERPDGGGQGARPVTAVTTRWISAYAPWMRGADMIFPQNDLECHRFSTVNVGLFLPRDSTDVNYAAIWNVTVEKAAREASPPAFASVCGRASRSVAEAWRRRLREGAPDCFGNVGVTVWHPEMGAAFAMDDPGGADALEYIMSHPAFSGFSSEEGRVLSSPVQPDCVVRFLNDRNEVCSVFRVSARDFAGLHAMAWNLGLGGDEAFWHTPQGRARFIYDQVIRGADPRFVREEGVVAYDILPGHFHRVAPHVMRPVGNALDRHVNEMRNMLHFAFLQTRAPFGEERVSLGCSQAFVPFTPAGFALCYAPLRDGAGDRNVFLLRDGDLYEPSPGFRQAAEEERQLLDNLSLGLTHRGERGPGASFPRSESPRSFRAPVRAAESRGAACRPRPGEHADDLTPAQPQVLPAGAAREANEPNWSADPRPGRRARQSDWHGVPSVSGAGAPASDGASDPGNGPESDDPADAFGPRP